MKHLKLPVRTRRRSSAHAMPFADRSRGPLLLIVGVILLSLISPLMFTRPALAESWPGTNPISEEVYGNVSGHQHYYWLYACFRHADIDKVTEGEIDSWDFFERDTNAQALGAMYPGKTASGSIQGTRDCQDESIVKTAFGYLGFTSPREVFCNLDGAEYRDGHEGTYDDCVAGVGDHDWDNGESNEKVAVSFEKFAKSKKPPFGGAEEYVRAFQTLVSERGCELKLGSTDDTLYTSESDVPGASSSATIYAVPVFVPSDAGDGYVLRYIKGVGLENGYDKLAYVATTSGNYDAYQRKSCGEIVNIARDNANAYGLWLRDHPDTPGSDIGNNDDSAPTPTCEADGFGWVICPLINMMAQITETVAEALDDYLRLDPLTTDTDSVLYKGWSNIVGLANILLLIAFMIIVFSQATSIGIGNYGIKKLLPRIIAAAILINISYFICAVLVDLSNIVGASISDLIYNNLGGITNDEQEGGFIGGVKNIAGGVAAGVIAASGLVIVAFFFLIPAVIAILSIFVVLAARTAIITLLIIIAPLAFAAWILPNTDKWFRKWWDMFLQMLVIYPAIMAIFAASTAAASIVVSSSGVSANETPGPGNLFPLLIGLLIQALPLFALPALIKLSSGVLARLDNMTRNGRFGKASQGFFERARDRRAGNVGARMAKNQLGQNKTGLSGKALRGVGATGVFVGGYNARRKFNFDKQKDSAERVQRRAILQEIGKHDSRYAKRAAGVEGAAGVARLRALATEQAIKERAEETDAHKMNLTRNSSMLASAGYTIQNGKLVDAVGQTMTSAHAADINRASGVDVQFDAQGNAQLDIATQRGLEYASENNLSHSVSGARALGATLAETGALETRHLESLATGLKGQPGVSVDDIGYTVDYLNDKASSAGLRHLQYNNVTPEGDLNLGGNMGGDTGVVKRIMQEGVSRITKEMYADNKFGTMIAQAVAQVQSTNPETFESELTKMNPRQIENLVQAQLRAGVITDATATLQQYNRQREIAIEKFGLPG